MSLDIVTRLRSTFHTGGALIGPEAADEIERLRNVVTTWIICAERLVESNEGEDYKKALAFYLDCQRIANETCR